MEIRESPKKCAELWPKSANTRTRQGPHPGYWAAKPQRADVGGFDFTLEQGVWSWLTGMAATSVSLRWLFVAISIVAMVLAGIMGLQRRAKAIRAEREAKFAALALRCEITTQACENWYPEKHESFSWSIGFRPTFWSSLSPTDHVLALRFRNAKVIQPPIPEFERELAWAIERFPRLNTISVEQGHPQWNSVKAVANGFPRISFRTLEGE